ncbi:MAG: hypothetical protein U0324_03070 [Polyangiales bacterium]
MRAAPLALALAALAAGAGCRRRRAPAPPPPPAAPASAEPAPAPPTEPEPVDPDELLPGSAVAYGLTLPASTIDRVSTDEVRMFYVPARMPQVMRYLQRRLEFSNGDIQPLGAMIRGARLRDSDAATVLDVGVRDEGDKTLLTLWNRTPVVGAPSRTMDEALRAAGYDPQTRQLQSRYNR